MKRLSIISLDGVDWSTLQPLIDAGKLPFISKVIENGHKSTLQTHSYVSSGSTWPSIHTGTHPGEHGIMFSHRQLKSGSYDVVKKQAEDIPFKAFWQVIAESGIPTIAFDLPKAPLIRNFNGLVLNSWGEEAPWYSASFPKNLKKEVHKKFSKHPLQEFYHRPMKDIASWKALKQEHIDALKTRFEIAEYLMEKQEDWGLFLMAINEIHLAGHLFWHIIDDTHVNHDPDLKEELGNILEDLLIITDQGLERLATRNPDAFQLQISNNGMAKNQASVAIMDILLKKMGYMSGKVSSQDSVSRGSHNVIHELEQKLPMAIVQWIKAKSPKKLWYKVTRKLTHSSKEWKKSQAFPLHNDVSGAIRLNLKGREPNGIVEEDDYDQLCEEISRDILKLTINNTQQPAVKRIIKVRAEFPGENVDELADLIVLWNNEKFISSLQSEKIGYMSVIELKRTGGHTDKGIFVSDEKFTAFLNNKAPITQDLSIYPIVLRFFEIPVKYKISNI